MSDKEDSKILKRVKPTRVILPVLFGLIGMGILIYYDENFTWSSFSLINFSWIVVLFIIISFIMMFVRDFGYMVRLRILSGNELNWRKSFNIIMLWEFASAVTPGAIGGTGVAVVFIHKEGINVGKSSAMVMATSFLDELYFVIMFPLIVLLVGNTNLFTIGGEAGEATGSFLTNKYFLFAVTAYAIKLAWTILMAYGLFKNPHVIKKMIVGIFKLRILKRWREKGMKAGNDVVLASDDFRTKPFKFWFKAFIATFFSWTARYWVLNFLLIAVLFGIPSSLSGTFPDAGEHMLIFARQLVMWVMMIILPTPGGSGIIELIFSDYMAEFMPSAGLIALMVIFWRLVTYYPYLLAGVLVLPKWSGRVFGKKK